MCDESRIRDVLDNLDSHCTPEDACGTDWELLRKVRELQDKMRHVECHINALFPDDTPTQRGYTESGNSAGDLPQIDGYDVECILGFGGMGVVYKAKDRLLDRFVAIKMMLAGPYASPLDLARFRREAEAVAGLRHPNIVRIHDEAAGQRHFVMEFVEGVDLDALVRKRGPLPVAEACEVLRQTSLGLQHIHEHGLVHGDIKPSNLMLTPAGQVKVLDLGLARLAHKSNQKGQITSPGQFLGTLDYMAPEQCDTSHTVDVRADIYGLGCTLYHLLAGGPPFAAFSSPYQKLRAHRETPVPPLCEQRLDVPGPLAVALVRMLAKDRNDRFASPADVIAAVHPFTFGADLPRLLPANLVPSLPDSPTRLALEGGQFEELASSEEPIRPGSYLASRCPAA